MEGRISGYEDAMEEMDTYVKENIKSKKKELKTFRHKISRKSGYYEKIKHKKNRNKGEDSRSKAQKIS